MNPQVDFYFTKATKWQHELEHLRMIMHDTTGIGYQLTEELKWGVPCYTFQASNIALIHVFKSYCALLFFKGALLNDPHGILVQQTANVQSARQIRFTHISQIVAQEAAIKTYIKQAIEVEQAGLQIAFKKTTDFTIPPEFQDQLAVLPALKTAFEALTPGRQRAYLLHFAAPKQAKTRQARVQNCIPQILNAKGLND